jgi:glycosyltransferase involved in cell wall biosynthesis
MKIGIQISLNLKNKGGNEEYVYQLLKHLPEIGGYKNHQFFLLAPFISNEVRNITGYIPKVLKWPFKWGWTQIRLSREILKNRPDILFVPAHTYPLIHPKTITVIHGVEFKAIPEKYSFWERLRLDFLTKRNIKAEKIIVSSQNTKNDLTKYYKVNPEKIFVVYLGVEKPGIVKNENSRKYILYLGSGHKRKNLDNLKKAYEILKNKYNIKHELILAGINKELNGQEKWELLKDADIFIYPSLYEGFGFPPLEAQSFGVPVVASNTGSLPEILGDSALLVNPYNPEEIAEMIYKIISDQNLKNYLINKGFENVKRFNWKNCVEQTFKIICE